MKKFLEYLEEIKKEKKTIFFGSPKKFLNSQERENEQGIKDQIKTIEKNINELEEKINSLPKLKNKQENQENQNLIKLLKEKQKNLIDIWDLLDPVQKGKTKA